MRKISFLLLFTFIITTFAVFMPKVEAATFKVQITSSKLSIRSGSSTKNKIVGYYTKGQVVDVLGQTGVFYKTNKGYIHSAYTKSIQLMSKVDNTGKYIVIKEDTPIYKSINGAADERYAVKGKTYRILEDKGDYYKIRQGALEGYVPVQNTEIINYTPKEKITLACTMYMINQ